MTPGQRGRLIGRVLLAIAFAVIGLTLFAFIAAPGFMGPDPWLATPPDVFGISTRLVVLVVGIVGVAVGLTWMIRIHRADPEPDQHAWRYRRDRNGVPIAQRVQPVAGRGPDMTPGQRGRRIGRAMIALACLAIIGGVGFLYLAASGGPSPMFDTPPDIFGLPANVVPTLAGAFGVIVGLAWMIRIHRADPEPDQHAWRYRRDR